MKRKMLIAIFILICISIIIFTFINRKNTSLREEKEMTNTIDYSYEDYKYDKNEKYPKSLKELSELPLPKRIIFYKNSIPYIFNYGSEEYNKIIKLNKNRNKKELDVYKTLFHNNISDLKNSIDLLEYDYENYGSVYFNLTGSYEYNLKPDRSSETAISTVKDTYWVYVQYDPNIFSELDYVGLEPAHELVNYLNSL